MDKPNKSNKPTAKKSGPKAVTAAFPPAGWFPYEDDATCFWNADGEALYEPELRARYALPACPPPKPARRAGRHLYVNAKSAADLQLALDELPTGAELVAGYLASLDHVDYVQMASRYIRSLEDEVAQLKSQAHDRQLKSLEALVSRLRSVA